MPRLSKIGAAALAAFGWTGGAAGPAPVTASYLVVAGGGGGGSLRGGGGGAGGLLTSTTSLDPALSYTITVGSGGAGTPASNPATAFNATSGSTSSLGAIASTVGGGGGGGGGAGSSGGSGGGGTFNGNVGGAGTAGQGNAGGTGATASAFGSGGGGGSSAVGTAGGTSAGGNGGAGTASSISGSSVTYAGGGGGGINVGNTGGTGGAGGGSNGISGSSNASPATANTGGGGGGAGYDGGSNSAGSGGNGGSGVVIISYAGAQQFGGGVVTSSGGNTIHTFTTSGTLSPLSSLSASYLIVAGGGGGGGAASSGGGGGGGAGGFLTGSGVTIDTNSTYLVTVGSGGTGGTGGSNNATAGGSSAFSMVTTTAVGGGNGGAGFNVGITGGSGGGGGANRTFGTGTAGQGTNGGAGDATASGGGGGGATSAGAAGSGAGLQGGAGGAGTASSISGASVTYAGGGGGGSQGSGGAGGAGGGGAGSVANGTAGTANLGGGGGAGGFTGGINYNGGAGGAGVVIISYAGATQLMAGGTVTISGGNVIHTFTSSGYLTPLTLLNNSLRFRASNSAYLNRTFIASSRTTWTWSAWVKLGALPTSNSGPYLFLGSQDGTNFTYIRYNADSSSQLSFGNVLANANSYNIKSSASYRDPAAWYHIVVVLNTTNATAANRMILYVNGVQVTSLASSSYPPQNDTSLFVNSANPHYIGLAPTTYLYFDGYMTNIQFIDGQALTPNSFGTFNSFGVWQPIRYGGSYGTNGFFLPFNAGSQTYGATVNASNYLRASNASAFAFGTGDFTVEAWVCQTSAVAYSQVAATNQTAGVESGAWFFEFSSTRGIAFYDSVVVNSSAYTVKLNQWYHVAVTRSGTNLRLFIDGIQQGSTFTNSTNLNATTGNLGILSLGNSTLNTVGTASNFRIVKGTAVYTANFKPPTANLTAVSGTSLLTLQNATIIDNSGNSVAITTTGTVPTSLNYPFSAGYIFNDQSPQGNNWTSNNISGVSGSTLDYMTDVPTLTSTTAANYATLNPIAAGDYFASGQTSLTLTNGNLNYGTGGRNAFGTIAVSSGKYYWEMSNTSNTASAVPLFGLVTVAARTAVYGVYYQPNGNRGLGVLNSGASEAAYGATWTDNDIIGVALDMDAATPTVTFYKNNASQGAISVSSFIGQSVMVWIQNGANSGNMSGWINHGQRPFTYTAPTNFLPLNTFNL
jgi:hypothetical protein